MKLRRKESTLHKVETVSHAFLHTYYRVSYSGYENIPKQGPAFLVPKHQSYLDIPLEGVMLRRKCDRYGNWIMRDNIPFPQELLYSLGGVKVTRPRDLRKIKDREGRKLELRRCKEMNRRASDYIDFLFSIGEIVIAHMEGTRTKGKVGSLRDELFGDVSKTEQKYGIKIPIIPIGIEYEHLWVPFSTINVKVGEPIDSDTPDLSDVVRNEIARLSNLPVA